MSATPDVRAQAARVLTAVLERGASLDTALPKADVDLPDARDRGLLRAIVFAALRSLHRLEALLGVLLVQPLKPRDRVVHALLLAGLAQLDQAITPAYAAVSGTAQAARALDRPGVTGLVNAVLRRFQRERDALVAALPKSDEVRYSHPAWLIARMRTAWPDAWREMLAANNEQPALWLRANRCRLTRAELKAQLAGRGIASAEHPLLGDALRPLETLDATGLPGFAAGDVSVQDGAAQLAVELMALAPGLRVLDACAAPGGKTAHLLEREPALAQVVALDHRADRVKRLDETLRRLGLAATTRVGDATAPQAWWDGCAFDRILIDAPCSGTGVIRRHPDIRVLRRDSDIAQHCALQQRLLDALWPLLGAGGRLVYATCSVLPDENADQIAAFLARTPDAVALDAVPHAFGRASGAGRQNLPGEGDMDGFFYAVVEKRA